MAFEDDVATAKASGRPFRIVLAEDGNRVEYLTQAEIDDAAARKIANDAREAAIKAKQDAIFSAARALSPLPSPYNQSELNAKVEQILTYLRRKFEGEIS